MQKDEIMLQKRLLELSNTAYHRGIVTYSDFLNLNELNILHTTPKHMFSSIYETFGGYGDSERQMAAFLPDALYLRENIKYPIRILKIAPLNRKFSEPLSHRDYLGAILNLGIERSKLGDILVEEEQAVLFAHHSVAQFLMDQLTRIRHTSVFVEEIEADGFSYQPKLEEIRGSIASVRLDSLLALAFSSSRSKLVPWIEGGRVFVNGRLMTTNSYEPKEGDIVSVRKMGRFRFVRAEGTTKKGRQYVVVEKYL